MKKPVLFLIPIFVLLLSCSSKTQQPAPSDLTIYAYDTLAAPGGLGGEVVSLFQKKFACRVALIASGGSGETLARIELEAKRGKHLAQIVWGIDQQSWLAIRSRVEQSWEPARTGQVPQELRVEKGFVPFDYGVYALIADTEWLKASGLKSPLSFSDLQDERLRRKLILEDPRTSAPGFAFLLFSRQLVEIQASAFWSKFSTQWLTLAPGWDAAYGLFLKHEAPLVWSYTTSEAYHRAHGDGDKYRAVLFKEGNPVQIEGAALLDAGIDAKTRELAHRFLEFLLTDEVQQLVMSKNWMLPVVEQRPVPEGFSKLPAPTKLIQLQEARREEVLAEWSRWVSSGAKR